jgi:thymidylate synthase (FAD)
MRIIRPGVELVSCSTNPEKLIERMGRICYKSEDMITEDSAPKFIRMIMQRGHESVLEHAVASFIITTDRGVTHEIVRHRLASYSQESTRYCNFSQDRFGGEITVIEPPGLGERAWGFWHSAVAVAEAQYLAMLNEGMSPQIARSVLPNCLKSDIGMTANFREWRHFLKLRTSPAAHPQMREIANLIAQILCVLSTTCFGEFLEKTDANTGG